MIDQDSGSSTPKVFKKPRRSYNCGPCRKLKIKCDTNLPCQNCTKYKRVDRCYAEPPHPLTKEQMEKRIQKKMRRNLAKQRRESRGEDGEPSVKQEWKTEDDWSPRGLDESEFALEHRPSLPSQHGETSTGSSISSAGGADAVANNPATAPEAQGYPPVFMEYPPTLMDMSSYGTQPSTTPMVPPPMMAPYAATFRPEDVQPIEFSRDAAQPQAPPMLPESVNDFYQQFEGMPPFPQQSQQDYGVGQQDTMEKRYLEVVREELELGSDVGPKIKALLHPMIPPKLVVVEMVEDFCENISPCYCTLRKDRIMTQINALDWDNKEKFVKDATFDFLALLFKFLAVACGLMSPQRFREIGFAQSFQNEPYNATFFYNNWSLQCMGHFDFFKQIIPYDRNEAYMNRIDVQRLSRVHSLFVTLSKDQYFQGLMTTMADVIVSGFGDQLNYESYSLLPKSVSKIDWSVEDRKAMWWMICLDDIENAVFFKRQPILRSHLSQVPWPSNINLENDTRVYDDDEYTDFTSARTRIQILTIIRKIFPAADVIAAGIQDPDLRALNTMLMMLNFERLVATAPYPRCFTCSDNDPLIANLTPERRVNYEFHRFQFVSDTCIHRYRLLMDYIYLDNPVLNSVCLDCLFTVFKAYNRLTTLYPIDGQYGARYVIMIPKFISIILNNLAYWLTYCDRLSDNLNIEMQYWIERLKNDTHRLSVSRLSNKLYIVQSIEFISARMYKDVNFEQMKMRKGKMLNLLPMEFVAANTTTYGLVPSEELYSNFKKDCENRMINELMEKSGKHDITSRPLFGSFGDSYVQAVVQGVASAKSTEANDMFDVKKSSTFNDTVVTLQRALGTSFPVYGYGSRFT